MKKIFFLMFIICYCKGQEFTKPFDSVTVMNLYKDNININKENNWTFVFTHKDSIYLNNQLKQIESNYSFDSIYKLNSEYSKGKKYYNFFGINHTVKKQFTFHQLKQKYNNLKNFAHSKGVSLIGFEVEIDYNNQQENISYQEIKTEKQNHFTKKSAIVDEDNFPIEFAEIKISNTQTGVIANSKGEFELQTPYEMVNEEIEIFAFGYIPKRIKAKDIESTIVLKEIETSVELKDVTKKGKKIKYNERGVKNPRKNVGAYIHNKGNVGAQVGRYFNNNEKIKLKSIFVFISNNKKPNFTLRSYIYNAHNGEIKDIIHQEIIESDIKKGWVEVKLKNNVIISNDFLVSYQWLDSKSTNPIISIAYGKDSQSYFKTNMFKNWQQTNNTQSRWAIKIKYLKISTKSP